MLRVSIVAVFLHFRVYQSGQNFNPGGRRRNFILQTPRGNDEVYFYPDQQPAERFTIIAFKLETYFRQRNNRFCNWFIGLNDE
jgi:hypothetical protein